MGMDYQHAGSANYARFDKEICEVAKVFGGALAEPYESRMESADTDHNIYGFGLLNVSAEDRNADKFVFPDGTPDIIADWLNRPYKYRNAVETREIWGFVSQHPQIAHISDQIWKELETLVYYNEGWLIW